ncbi:MULTISPECIES: carboxylate-amine ligase [Streptomyces]|uniref:carboxylate-amine ligase n=1 Tax=Streptomyces TaxID=1883 RepID=UPI00163B86E3|nr:MULTISPECIES: YbdK family carboxylate-amine ligase [Streptomyces]MBC2879586.1 YbdK family carboxylate-amine ligase [Streptomyces sp. TYQ1024]UBI40134.1 YbdK family carboxylate-amine ligase [Streptomyces mobaraensis]UKW32713.1 YbdK family carboxylate-amine ligase [Streptomyces sp. TYQ1024]
MGDGGGVPTVGVEEEYFLVRADTRAVAPAGPRVADRAARALGDSVAGEFTDFQVEVRTPPCATMDELHAHVVRLRRSVAAYAAEEGLRICPSGTPVIGGGGRVPVGDHLRYRAGVDLFRSLMDDFAVCSLHVHVSLPDREVAALVGNHLRAWLPMLVEMSANSPFYDGRDTGYASWRSVIRLRFPGQGPQPYVESFDDYRRIASAMAEAGAMSFAELPFWDVRPHPRLPTLEVRCMDVPAEPADSAAVAAVVRGLVVTCARLVENGDNGPRLRGELLRGIYWRSARDGWPGQGLDPVPGRVLPAPERARGLVDHIRAALEELGDLERVTAFLDRLAVHGTGAHRQRAAYRAGGLSAVVDDLTRATTSPGSGPAPDAAGPAPDAAGPGPAPGGAGGPAA